MKKLALVTLLAVAASWLLSEDRRPVDEMSAMVAALDRFKAGDPARPSEVIFAPAPPLPRWRLPEPPASPDPIHTVPWRKGQARPGRPVAAPSTRPLPPWFPKSEIDEEARSRPDSTGIRVLLGRLSASEDRARQDLRKTLEREVADWIAADVPPTWKAPAPAIDELVRSSYVQQVTRSLKPSAGEALAEAAPPSKVDVPGLDDLYTLYRAGQQLDFSPYQRARIVELYRHDLATWRMQRLGGGLALALVGLAVMTGYIRADEATRGYYTNRLRLAAAAGLGVAGVAAYRMFV